MITAVTYNCDPESLADVTPEAFVDAFENEVRVRPSFCDLAITVTFNAGKSEVTSFASDDWEAGISHEDELREWFRRMAEKAFAYCCSGGK